VDEEIAMRTNIVIDDALLTEAMQATGLTTKRAVVEAGLRLLVQLKGQTEIRRLRGKIPWVGDLNEMRLGRLEDR
jgi:Arc/MetJ family transcription regulator